MELEEKPLPDVFVNVVKKKKWVEMSTLDMMKRNGKVRLRKVATNPHDPCADPQLVDQRLAQRGLAHEWVIRFSGSGKLRNNRSLLF